MKRTIINGLIAGLAASTLAACGGTTDSSSNSKMLATTAACYAAWNSTVAYNGGAQVSYNGVNYTAAYWTQGNNPSTSNGPAGSGQPWISNGACGSTPTPTPTPAPTPTPTPAPTPTPTPAPTPTSTCTLQAEDYSNAYDDSAGNAGGAYRTGDVDIEGTSDTGGGYNVGWIDTGEWLVHNNVTFPTTGNYTVQYRVASPNSTGVISADLNAGSIQLGTTAVPNTGGWQTWTTVQRTVTVNAGTYNLGTYFSTGGLNLNWIKVVGATCSPTPTPTPAPTPAPTPTPTPAPTPTPTSTAIVGGYYPSWVASPVRLRNIDSHYNLIYLFAATAPAGDTSGKVTWTPPSDVNGAATNWNADIQYARTTQHRKIILSVGGAGHAMSFPNRTVSTNFVNSIDALYNQWGGFDGLDWNTFEGQTPDTSEMIWASQELKRRHPGFIITAPPAPWNTTDQQFCVSMLNAGALDYCAPQYYDGPNLATPSWALPNIDTWVSLIGASHVVVGFGIDPNTANYWTIGSAVSTWQQVKAKYPTIHGAFDWQINNDLLQGYPFAQQLGPLVP